MLVRSTPPEIRSRLIERLQDTDIGGSLRSLKAYLALFKHPAPSEVVLANTKGMELVEFHVYKGNHKLSALSLYQGLRYIASRHLERTLDVRRIQLESRVVCINSHIKINGTQWKPGDICEFMQATRDDPGAMSLGRITALLVLSYTASGQNGRRDSEVFVQFNRFAASSIIIVGEHSSTHYRVRLATCTTTIAYVHVSACTTLMYAVPDNRGPNGVALLTPADNAFQNGYMYMVPLARAFETVNL
jgi:hypothetical protein